MEKPSFYGQPLRETGQSLGTDNSMTGHQDGNRIPGQGLPHGPIGPWPADSAGQPAVGTYLSVRDLRGRLPYLALKGCSQEHVRKGWSLITPRQIGSDFFLQGSHQRGGGRSKLNRRKVPFKTPKKRSLGEGLEVEVPQAAFPVQEGGEEKTPTAKVAF